MYRVGQRVDGLYDENADDMWYPGRIRSVHRADPKTDDADVTFEVLYDDGEVEMNVRLEFLRQHVSGTICAGTRVLCRYDGGDEFYPGQVSDVQENGRYTVAYDDGEVEENVPVDYIVEPEEEEKTETEDPAEEQKMPAERTYVIESLQLLEKRLGDAASTKSVLSTLVKQMRAYPQVTADLVHERGGERLIIDALKFHQAHAVIQCYGCVLLRRLCFLCVKSTNFLLHNGIVELVIQAMNSFAEDAILQASACGALAVFTRVHTGLNSLIEFQVAQLVLSTLIYHKTYSVHTRQVHYYACEVLLELCELDDLQTLNLLCGEQEEDFMGDMSPISLLLFLLRQGLSLDDKKACCAVGSLLMCLAASGKRAATLILGLNGLAELSTVMARYPTEPSIQKYSSAASKQIALCSVRQSPTKRIKDTATVILREAESIEHTPAIKPVPRRGAPRRTTSTGKRKSNPSSRNGSSAYSRGATYSSNTPYRNAPGFSRAPSRYEQFDSGCGGDMNSFGYPVRDFHTAATAPQQPSSLVILDGNLGDSGFRTNKHKPPSKEDRQSELFDAYGIHGFPNSTNGRPYGTKRAQLKAHLASAESTWATPQHIPSSHSSRSEHFDPGSAYSHQDFMPSRQNRYNEAHNPSYYPELRQPRGAKRKKKNPGMRTAFQVRVENENQLRVSREAHLQYPSPQRLGAATKRAAKARQKRITAAGHSSMTGKLNDASTESLNDYATQLFQDNTSRTGSGSSRLTPREKEEIRERERLSFAEKLHKMIDKAKSTLANGNLTSVPTVDTVSRPKKAGTGTKTARKARELSTTPSEDKRQSKKTRTVNSSTPKHVTKEILSPRDTAEIRPAKPTSIGATKRATAINDPPSAAVSRAKPSVSRSVVTPDATTDQKPRAAIKSSKAPPTKPIDKHEAEQKNEPAVSVASVDATPKERPSQDDVDAVESVAIAAPPVEPKPVEQVEPVVSSGEDDVMVSVQSDAVSQSDVDPTSGDNGNISGADAVVEEVAVVTTPAEGHIPVDIPLDATVKPAPEQSEPSADAQQNSASEPTDDQPSGGNATVDAMYGDAYGEFDDNGGDDEDMAEAEIDTGDDQMPVTEPLNPPVDIPLQQSKSGEALYDDGYDEFDDDEAPNDEETEEAEVGDAPATEPVDNQDKESSDNIASEPPEIESDVAAKLPEVESEQLTGEDAPIVAGERKVSDPTEDNNVGDESSPNDNDDGNREDDVVNESKHATVQELQPNTTDIDNAEEALDIINAVNPVTEPSTEKEAEDATQVEQVDAAMMSILVQAPRTSMKKNLMQVLVSLLR
ncbi:Hypothetical protein PHPALM_19603 [Phytophthora palmivora]|uniref:Tudor domain-containing protein n=1 Tax=Phytophthora palmivora TaxID=4796 RepID=A0A2P4XH04_9STRA|nr:Hypothetical protein PHPALM_19603 [Phytophthora palmivora]